MKGKHDGQPELMSKFRAWKALRAGDGLCRQVTGVLAPGSDLWSLRCAGIIDREIW